jgi:hypothetical protein
LGPKEHAKRYGGEYDTPEEKYNQTKVIQEGLESRLNPTPGSMFYEFRVEQKATDYQGLGAHQVELVLEEVDFVHTTTKVHTVVNGDGTVTKY